MLSAIEANEPPAQAAATYDAARPLALMHVPKTSGIALAACIADAVQPRRVVSGLDRCVFGDFDRFDTIAPEIRRGIYLTPAEMPADGDFVTGHLARSTLACVYPGAQLLTFLREPRARLLSFWVYWRAQDSVPDSAWGAWATHSRASHASLADFLGQRPLAAQTDNLALRMLLWPHPLIPPADFIAECHEAVLLSEALARLRRFAYADVIENARLAENLSAWLGRPVRYTSMNETPPVPPALRVPLHRELTAAAYELLHARSRLDLWLWTALAERRVHDVDVAHLCEHAMARTVARCAALLAG